MKLTEEQYTTLALFISRARRLAQMTHQQYKEIDRSSFFTEETKKELDEAEEAYQILRTVRMNKE